MWIFPLQLTYSRSSLTGTLRGPHDHLPIHDGVFLSPIFYRYFIGNCQSFEFVDVIAISDIEPNILQQSPLNMDILTDSSTWDVQWAKEGVIQMSQQAISNNPIISSLWHIIKLYIHHSLLQGDIFLIKSKSRGSGL